MKKLIALLVLAITFNFAAQAQSGMAKDADVVTVKLEQTKGEFTQKNVTLKEGTYVFNVTNNQAGTDVGFVLVPEGKDASNPDNHIKEAYVTKVVKEGTTESSSVVTLSKGTYKYFCPLNKTPQYTLVVK